MPFGNAMKYFYRDTKHEVLLQQTPLSPIYGQKSTRKTSCGRIREVDVSLFSTHESFVLVSSRVASSALSLPQHGTVHRGYQH